MSWSCDITPFQSTLRYCRGGQYGDELVVVGMSGGYVALHTAPLIAVLLPSALPLISAVVASVRPSFVDV